MAQFGDQANEHIPRYSLPDFLAFDQNIADTSTKYTESKIGHTDFYSLHLFEKPTNIIDAINQIIDKVDEYNGKQDEFLTQTHGYRSAIPLGDILSTPH
jgi:hypothetical protein